MFEVDSACHLRRRPRRKYEMRPKLSGVLMSRQRVRAIRRGFVFSAEVVQRRFPGCGTFGVSI